MNREWLGLRKGPAEFCDGGKFWALNPEARKVRQKVKLFLYLIN
jgi:hypothetical protein